MKCTLIGMGCGPEHLTHAAEMALQEAELIIGARRMLDMIPCDGMETNAWSGADHDAGIRAQRIAEYRPREIAALLQASTVEHACVVYSGDSGFYSGAAGLLPLLQEIEGMEIQVMPGISSLQEFAAQLGECWQDWNLCSVHGASCDPVYEAMQGRKTFYLTAGAESPRRLCGDLTEAGLGALDIAVGENLGTEAMQIWRGTAQECAQRIFAPLNVMRVATAPRYPVRTPGIPDEEFLREQVPMTKQEVRAAILAKLAVTPEDVCWDIGAGTGSVSVELALHARRVWAVEHKPEAVHLIRRNRERFCAWNLHVVEGTAPEAMAGLPRPDVVFVGGSSGQMEQILRTGVVSNPQVRICVSAIALETLHQAVTTLEQLGYEPEVTQIAVSRTRAVGDLHLLMAQNPVFLITAIRK